MHKHGSAEDFIAAAEAGDLLFSQTSALDRINQYYREKEKKGNWIQGSYLLKIFKSVKLNTAEEKDMKLLISVFKPLSLFANSLYVVRTLVGPDDQEMNKLSNLLRSSQDLTPTQVGQIKAKTLPGKPENELAEMLTDTRIQDEDIEIVDNDAEEITILDEMSARYPALQVTMLNNPENIGLGK